MRRREWPTRRQLYDIPLPTEPALGLAVELVTQHHRIMITARGKSHTMDSLQSANDMHPNDLIGSW